MKKIGYVAVATLLGVGLVGSAQAHVFVGMSVEMPVMPVAPVAPVVAVAPYAPVIPVAPFAPVAPVPVYAPPVAYYAPPAPVYAPSVAVGYWGGRPGWGYRHYAAGYWR
ncbi:hypothetical protein CBA19CS11_16540 [Caballeronia novacaledonica]|uniref:hypothetical protein n=1 Tax=Caballeronia novacaledonica TaxID=1544861 RepID=UPI001EE384D2|nr:hypothetical protein [Caballeronia novacaledonica]GJH10468.1 hypothetical protein CBA19CS11_16540 [Caballeronia novacaledonica]